MGKVRLFAHPDNPDARRRRRSAARAPARRSAPKAPPGCNRCAAARWWREGTVLGHVQLPPRRQGRSPALRDPPGRRPGHDRPRARSSRTGSSSARRFTRAGAKTSESLTGATACEVFLLSQRAALAAEILVRPGHRAVRLLARRDRLRADRQARAGPARVPVALRPEADGRAPCAAARRATTSRATSRHSTSATRSRSPRSTASAMAGPPGSRARSPTRRSARC